MMQAPLCPVHQIEAQWKQGISKKTGKPYAFWSCNQKDVQGNWCSAKIEAMPPAVAEAQAVQQPSAIAPPLTAPNGTDGYTRIIDRLKSIENKLDQLLPATAPKEYNQPADAAQYQQPAEQHQGIRTEEIEW